MKRSLVVRALLGLVLAVLRSSCGYEEPAAPEASRIILRSPHAEPTRIELEGAVLAGHEGRVRLWELPDEILNG